MKKFTTLLGLAFIALTATSIASAATFDFIGYADDDGNHERGYGPGSSDDKTSFVVSEEGIQLTATGYKKKHKGWKQTAAYLDYGNAGLGVCSSGFKDDDQCAVNADDNVTYEEKLMLTFEQSVSLDELVLKNGSHHNKFQGKFDISIDGSAWRSFDLAHTLTLNLIGKTFELYNPQDDDSNKRQFYISAMTVSAVPIPAAIWLFGSALFGFVAMRRNTKVTT